MTEFRPFGKIPRLFRSCVITEKLDGTNAQVYIESSCSPGGVFSKRDVDDMFINIYAGSRNRWVTPEDDNYGFASWVVLHGEQLVKLGHGHHYGEWWGSGINRGYNLNHRRFSLFNAIRWTTLTPPECCMVVPILYEGTFSTESVSECVDQLRVNGSRAQPGYPNPEGVIVFHQAANAMFKVTLDNDSVPKGI